MKEEEWLTATDPTPMLEFLRGKASDRKLRLFACLCLRETFQYHPRAANEPLLEWIVATEAVVDGRLTPADWEKVRAGMPHNTFHPHSHATSAARAAAFDAARHKWRFGQDTDIAEQANQEQRQTIFLRDLIGNPFRLASVDPAWRTSDVLALAEGIYAERAFDRMPILADALQDAGCDNDDILNHCRDTSFTHVRGCWVIDLLTGRE